MLENGRVTLQQICAWIESKFAFFRVRKKWNVSHNLNVLTMAINFWYNILFSIII